MPTRPTTCCKTFFAGLGQRADRYAEQGKPRAYLLRIADRLACDWAHRRGREQRFEDERRNAPELPALENQPLRVLLGAESRQQLNEALDALSEAQRRTLLLRYYGDLDFAEIARIMDSPINTVLSHARCGLVALRRSLSENIE